jgi:hypothetical protein
VESSHETRTARHAQESTTSPTRPPADGPRRNGAPLVVVGRSSLYVAAFQRQLQGCIAADADLAQELEHARGPGDRAGGEVLHLTDGTQPNRLDRPAAGLERAFEAAVAPIGVQVEFPPTGDLLGEDGGLDRTTAEHAVEPAPQPPPARTVRRSPPPRCRGRTGPVDRPDVEAPPPDGPGTATPGAAPRRTGGSPCPGSSTAARTAGRRAAGIVADGP